MIRAKVGQRGPFAPANSKGIAQRRSRRLRSPIKHISLAPRTALLIAAYAKSTSRGIREKFRAGPIEDPGKSV